MFLALASLENKKIWHALKSTILHVTSCFQMKSNEDDEVSWYYKVSTTIEINENSAAQNRALTCSLRSNASFSSSNLFCRSLRMFPVLAASSSFNSLKVSSSSSSGSNPSSCRLWRRSKRSFNRSKYRWRFSPSNAFKEHK